MGDLLKRSDLVCQYHPCVFPNCPTGTCRTKGFTQEPQPAVIAVMLTLADWEKYQGRRFLQRDGRFNGIPKHLCIGLQKSVALLADGTTKPLL